MNDIRCNPSSLLLPLTVGVFVLKFLLINCYYSTDFEVHRNWLAITHNLPLAHWYTEATSQWTLDYPPLFAWFEFVLAQFAAIIWPTASSQMLTISAQPYIDTFTLYFQRISVIVADVIYVFAVYRLVGAVELNHPLPPHRSNWRRCMLTALLIANTGLLLVDSVHFQYNSLLSAILLVAIANAIDGRLLYAALWYSLLLNSKHIYLYYAPAFVCYYLVHYFNRSYLNCNALYRAVQLAVVIAMPFAVAFGPFIWCGQLTQVLQRMFPFQRGLTHAYWAPNIWSLYNCIDLILYHGIKRIVSINTLQPPTYTSGLVQSYSHSVLPSINPSTTALLTIASMIPFLIVAYNRNEQRPVRFVELLIACAFSTYLFGWHVHEKAVILITIPYIILVVDDRRYISSFVILITTAHYSLFPLLFTQFEISIKYLSTLIYSMFAIIGLSHRYGLINMKTSQLSPLKYIYIVGLVCVEIYKCVVHRFLFINDAYPFIPLLITSVYCSIGMIMIWIEFCWLTFIKDYCQFIYRWMWSREQKQLKSKLRVHIDNDKWNKNNVRYVGGVDISTSLNDDGIACACFVVLSYPELKIVHQETEIVCIDEPYIAGYLAFREFRPLIKLIKNVKQSHPDIFPQVIFVDGNGILHPRGFGLACHIGVLTDVVCIGVAKNLHLIDGIVEDSNKLSKQLNDVGDQYPIQSMDGQILGAAVRVTSNSNNAIFISIGHCIDLQTSIQLTIHCCQHRIPEPIRMADQISRTEIRNLIDN